MIFNDPEFMESIRRGLEEARKGETMRCESEDEMDRLFKSLARSSCKFQMAPCRPLKCPRMSLERS